MDAQSANGFRYHAQQQAAGFARQILTVPAEYPVYPGLADGFRDSFARLCAWARGVYQDMARDPAAFGLMLLDISDKDHNLARDSYRTIHRFVDVLNAMALSGEAEAHCLRVDADRFRKAVKSNPGVPVYGRLLARLRDHGLLFSGLEGESVARGAASFTVQCPDDPPLIDTIKAYCECWQRVDRFRNRDNPLRNEWIKLSPQEFHHHFYRFDYKITADLAKLPVLAWVNDEADYLEYGAELKRFHVAFYQAALAYEGLKFDGEYHCKGKRVARITSTGYSALGTPDYRLSLKLKNMDKYADVVASLPERIKAPMTRDSCRNCGFQGATAEQCKFRLRWTLDGARHVGCAFWCFFFDDYRIEAIPAYLALLEREYGLKRKKEATA